MKKTYIVRDKENNLRIFNNKPHKKNDVWVVGNVLSDEIVEYGTVINEHEILDLFKCLTFNDEPILFNPYDKKIDGVIFYVNGEDDIWKKQYERYCKLNDNNFEINESHSKAKVIDYGVLKYLFRSIDKNAKFINNIYLVVQSDSQVPDWVNRDTVKVVLHEEFIPKEFLPTYNSFTIDMFVHKIHGISERFLVFEDDMVVTDNISENTFFNGYKTKETMEDRDISKLDPSKNMMNYQKLWLRSSNLVKKEFNEEESDNLYWRTNHGVSPIIKCDMEYLTQKYRNEIRDSITMFRDSKNYVRWMFRYFTWKKNGMEQNGVNHGYFTFKDKSRLLEDLYNSKKYQTIVIQEFKFEDGDEHIVEKGLNRHFPNKCKYEI